MYRTSKELVLTTMLFVGVAFSDDELINEGGWTAETQHACLVCTETPGFIYLFRGEAGESVMPGICISQVEMDDLHKGPLMIDTFICHSNREMCGRPYVTFPYTKEDLSCSNKEANLAGAFLNLYVNLQKTRLKLITYVLQNSPTCMEFVENAYHQFKWPFP